MSMFSFSSGPVADWLKTTMGIDVAQEHEHSDAGCSCSKCESPFVPPLRADRLTALAELNGTARDQRPRLSNGQALGLLPNDGPVTHIHILPDKYMSATTPHASL